MLQLPMAVAVSLGLGWLGSERGGAQHGLICPWSCTLLVSALPTVLNSREVGQGHATSSCTLAECPSLTLQPPHGCSTVVAARKNLILLFFIKILLSKEFLTSYDIYLIFRVNCVAVSEMELLNQKPLRGLFLHIIPEGERYMGLDLSYESRSFTY